jgi:hypothetical protein
MKYALWVLTGLAFLGGYWLIATLLLLGSIGLYFWEKSRPTSVTAAGQETRARLSLPFSVEPEIARLVRENMAGNKWLELLASKGELHEYEKFLVSRLEETYTECCTGQEQQDYLTPYSGVVLVTVMSCLEYSILLDNLISHINDFSKEKTLYLLQKFHGGREIFTSNMYSLNMEHITKMFLEADSSNPAENTLEKDELMKHGFQSWQHFKMSLTIINEQARFTFETLVWWYAAWIPLLKLGHPEPNEHNQSFQFVADAAKEQADKKWLESAGH